MRNWILVASLLLCGVAPARAERERRLTVMTRNMDAGTDLGPVIVATSIPALLAATAATYLEVVASGAPERAARIADEIAAARPDLIALQEVTLWRTGAFLQPPATRVLIDQLDLLLSELGKRGLHYAPVVLQTGTDAEAPVPFGFDLRISDRDVILARSESAPRLKLSNPQTHVYQAELVLGSPVLGQLAVPRSWISVDVKVRGRSFRFVDTHLEGFAEPIQVAQAEELIAALGSLDIPVILAGDFNANAEPGIDHFPTTDDLLAAGFVDSWAAAHPGDAGYTWPLHGEDPQTDASAPFERIDLIYGRGVEVKQAQRIGASPADRTASGLWPSDHAGVVAVFELGESDDDDL